LGINDIQNRRVALASGDVQASLELLNRALSLSIQVGNDEEKATSLHAIGYAYEVLNKPAEELDTRECAIFAAGCQVQMSCSGHTHLV
jgi:hypothetical protein